VRTDLGAELTFFQFSTSSHPATGSSWQSTAAWPARRVMSISSDPEAIPILALPGIAPSSSCSSSSETLLVLWHSASRAVADLGDAGRAGRGVAKPFIWGVCPAIPFCEGGTNPSPDEPGEWRPLPDSGSAIRACRSKRAERSCGLGLGRSAIGGERERKKAALVILWAVGEVGPDSSVFMLIATGMNGRGRRFRSWTKINSDKSRLGSALFRNCVCQSGPRSNSRRTAHEPGRIHRSSSNTHYSSKK